MCDLRWTYPPLCPQQSGFETKAPASDRQKERWTGKGWWWGLVLEAICLSIIMQGQMEGCSLAWAQCSQSCGLTQPRFDSSL